jgi:hypothetical protein
VLPEQFELLQGAENLSTYTFNTGLAKHLFCKTCGMHPFYKPRSHPNHIDVNLRCIDEPIETLLQQFEVQPFNGRHWEDSINQIADSE